jgi:putative addiction module killer protein
MKVAIRRGRVITVGDKYILKQSTIFDEWLNGFTDRKTQGRIRNRIDKARAGNFGKVESVRDGVFEMQLHFGPGYRIYFFRLEKDVYWLLCGGDKSSQAEDVKLAKMLKREKEREHERQRS